TVMKNPVIFLAILSLLFFVVNESAFAQEQTTRFLKQHKAYFLKYHLDQTDTMIMHALQSNSLNMKETAVQTIRELEEVFPKEPFTLFIDPLSNMVRDEKADIHLRILSALALDKLHSDEGDKIIYDVAKNTANESIKNVCEALAIESFKAEEMKNIAYKYHN
ncbi:MAG: hypothetical protein P8Z35_23280, partial [Ignavibacteriaceae bacterium]